MVPAMVVLNVLRAVEVASEVFFVIRASVFIGKVRLVVSDVFRPMQVVFMLATFLAIFAL